MSVGIERIRIIGQNNGIGGWRFDVSNSIHQEKINKIYQANFNLLPGCKYLEVSKEDKLGRYDIDFGVDVILYTVEGHSMTSQEKTLTTDYETVTVEYYQNHRTNEEGNWFKLKCDYYFVGYVVGPMIKRWILLDWNVTRRLSSSIPWQINKNRHDNARSNFKYCPFDLIPSECVIDRGSIL